MSTTDPKPAKGEEWRDLDLVLPEFDAADDADILKDAEANIRAHRLRPVTFQLRDRTGKPLAQQHVQVELLRHAFPFGEQVWSLDAKYRNGEQNAAPARAWRNRFEEVFNAATNLCYWTERPQNDASKTEEYQGENRVENFADTVAWTRAKGMIAKGHPLFWSIPKCTPDWVKRYDIDTYWKFAEVRVRNLVARFRGQVTIWDVVNEALWEAAPQNMNARHWPHIESTEVMADYIEKVMIWCREEDPDATYLINDYGLISKDQPKTGSDGSVVTASSQRKRYAALANELSARGCAPDAIGCQGHTGFVPLRLLNDCLNELGSATGLPVHITEFWASAKPLTASGKFSPAEIQEILAEYIRRFVTVAYGNPHLEGFFFWGLMGSAIEWQPSGGHKLLPAYETVRKLLRETWWVKEDLQTNADGEITLPLYAGEYAVRRRMENGRDQGRRVHIAHPAPKVVPLQF